MVDKFKFTTIAHKARSFLGPYSSQTLDRLVPNFDGVALDVGCGKGAALSHFGGQGIGIEHNPAFCMEARKRNPLAQIWEEDVVSSLARVPRPIDLLICLGAAQAVGTSEEAVSAFTPLLNPGGLLLFGEGYWRQKPSPEYLEFLGGNEDDMPYLDQILVADRYAGLRLLSSLESSVEEWDEYETSYFQSVSAWCDRHAEDAADPDPDSQAFRARVTAWNDGYQRWGRETLGFSIQVLQKT